MRNFCVVVFLLLNSLNGMDNVKKEKMEMKSAYNGPMSFEIGSRFNTLKISRSEHSRFEFNIKSDDCVEKVYSGWFYDASTVSERVRLILFYMDQNCGCKQRPLQFQILFPNFYRDVIINRYKEEFAKDKSVTEKVNNQFLGLLCRGNENIAGVIRSFMPIIPHPLFISKPVRNSYFTQQEAMKREFLPLDQNPYERKKRNCVLQ